MLNKINKTIGLLRKLQNILPRSSLLTIYKSFIRPNFDYGDVIYDQMYNVSFQQRVESIQYNAALAITGAIRVTSNEKLFKELGLESLQHRRWYSQSSLNGIKWTLKFKMHLALIFSKRIFCWFLLALAICKHQR